MILSAGCSVDGMRLRGPVDEARSSIAGYPEATRLTWLKTILKLHP